MHVQRLKDFPPVYPLRTKVSFRFRNGRSSWTGKVASLSFDDKNKGWKYHVTVDYGTVCSLHDDVEILNKID